MSSNSEIRKALLAGERPIDVTKRHPRATVYRMYSELIASGELPNSDVFADKNVATDEDDEQQAPPGQSLPGGGPLPFTVRRRAPSASGKTANIVDFVGQDTMPADTLNAVGRALGVNIVPEVLRMPMPQMLYTAMVISVAEFGWRVMAPQDFIDTVIKQWLEACDIVVQPYGVKSRMQNAYEQAVNLDENNPALKKYIAEHNLISVEQAQQMFGWKRVYEQVDPNNPGNGGNGNGNGNGHTDACSKPVEPTPPAAKVEVNPEFVSGKPMDITVPIPINKSTISAHEVTPIQDLHKFDGKVTNETIIANITSAPGWLAPRLRANGIMTIGQLTSITPAMLSKMNGFGDLMVQKVQQWLIGINLHLKDDLVDKFGDKTVAEFLQQPATDVVKAINPGADVIAVKKEDTNDGANGRIQPDGAQNRTQPEGGTKQGEDSAGGHVDGKGNDSGKKV